MRLKLMGMAKDERVAVDAWGNEKIFSDGLLSYLPQGMVTDLSKNQKRP